VSSGRIAQSDSDGPRMVAAGALTRSATRANIALIAAFLAVEVLAVTAFQAPNQTLVRFAALDSGGELAIGDLIRRGFRPGVDFGYPYGLLPLLVGRLWYGLAGLSPGSFNVEVTACVVLSSWGLARLAAYRRVGVAGLVLIALAIPDLIFVTYLTSAHAIEQALLIHALAEQARGRRSTALALLTACCFVKPSLAFVQGLAVVVAILAAGRRAGRAATARSIVPPLATAAVLAAVLAASFGPSSLARTLSPATGAAIYRASNYGFFRGTGREFWVLPGGGLRDYFRYEVGFWLLGTALLSWAGLVGARRLARGVATAEGERDEEIVVTCAAVHLAFVALLFGHRLTWVYSLPMLVAGLATLANRGPRHASAAWVLAALLLVSDRSKAVDILRHRKADSPSPAMHGLWSSPGELREWERALELTRGRRPALLATCEGATVLFPGLAPPVGGYLIAGNMRPVEADRKADQLAGASMIISAHPPDWDGFRRWPRIAAAFDGCELIFEGRSLRVYRRRPAAPASPRVRP